MGLSIDARLISQVVLGHALSLAAPLLAVVSYHIPAQANHTGHFEEGNQILCQGAALCRRACDLRRALGEAMDPHQVIVRAVMTPDPISIEPDALAVEAVQLMEQRSIQGLLVLDSQQQLAGVLNFHDLLRSGVV